MKKALIFGVILLAGLLNVNGQLDDELPYFQGKTITTSIINSVSIILDSAAIGDYLEIKVECYEAICNDLKSWSQLTGNDVELVKSEPDYKVFRITKMANSIKHKRFAIIISNDGLEELLSPLGFAWAAALSGMDVSIYLQGPAVQVVEEGYKEKLNGINSLFSGFARKGLNEIGHIPPQEKLKELHRLGAKIYVCQPSMDHFKVKKSDLVFTDVILAEYLTLWLLWLIQTSSSICRISIAQLYFHGMQSIGFHPVYF